ncbi:MAG: response regulator [Candidatus Eisenbacteria bacterium]|nr:response regulator [Candidatus Eisenbacteria bacterium]
MTKWARDPYVLLATGTALLSSVLFALPPVRAAGLAHLWAGHFAEPCLLALVVITFLATPLRHSHREERLFWNQILTTSGFWLVGNVAEYVMPLVGRATMAGFVRDAFYLLSYVSMILAADLRPHLPSGWTRASHDFQFAVVSTFLAVLGLLLYFFTLPLLEGEATSLRAPTLTTFLALDVLLAVRFAHLAFRALLTPWGGVYACLMVALVAAVVSDGLNSLIDRGLLHLGFGTPLDVVWWVPMIGFVAARRVRAGQRASAVSGPVEQAEEPLTDSTGLLLFYALSFPAAHVLLNIFGSRTASRPEAHMLVLAALVAFVSLAVAQQRTLERRNRDLLARLRSLVTNEQIVQSAKLEAVGLLAGGLAHDFNNLLTVIMGRGEMLRASLRNDDQRSDAQEIVNTAHRAAGITRQLLAFSRRQVMRTLAIDLNAAIREGEPILRRLVGERHRIVTELADDLPAVEADPSQVFQVLLNLVANARDAMPDGGAISIRTAAVTLSYADLSVVPPTSGGAYVAMTVCDTGSGIEPETQERMFDPFFTSKLGGTGLGLAVVYGIVTQSGGHIRIESSREQGTAFTILLPHARSAAPSADPAPGSYPSLLRRHCILLVEDQEPVRASVRSMLETLGHEVLEAASGEEALALHLEAPDRPDILLTDIVMPGLRGPEVAERIRALHPEIVVVFMSGFVEREMESAISRDPDTVLLTKPFTLDALRMALASAWARRVRTSAPS